MHPIQDDCSDAGMTRAIEANFLAAFEQFRTLPQVQIVESPYVMRITSSAVPDPLVNGILRAQFPPDSADRHVEEIVAYFRERHLPLLWQIWPSTRPDDLGARLVAAGLSAAGWNAGMALDLHQVADPLPLPPDLTIQSVENEVHLQQWLRTLSAGFELQAEVVNLLETLSRQAGFGGGAAFQNYVGFVADQPAACASMIFGAGVAGIYNVVTLPDVRGLGLGTALTYRALLDARSQGYRIAILHSTQMGYSIYYRLGFREYFTIHKYFSEAPYGLTHRLK
ncbi:MAG: GNAT family N-acetyltransferase [Anaerolineae bacterium]|nr:GNAT family N-acetyltransferase [Anaerolineae bacterium]